MRETLQWLQKSEREALLRLAEPRANRQRRRSVGGAPLSWVEAGLQTWLDQRSRLCERARAAVEVLASRASLLDGDGNWQTRPSEQVFRQWVSDIATELNTDRTTAAITIVALLSSWDRNSLVVTKVATVPEGRDACESQPVGPERPAEGAGPATVRAEHGPDDDVAPPLFDDWFEAVSRQPPGWAGWERVSALAARLTALANARIEERRSLLGRMETVLTSIEQQGEELDYLEQDSWRCWRTALNEVTLTSALVERAESLVAVLSRHAELRLKRPHKRSEEAAHQGALSLLHGELDALYEAIDSAFAATLAPGALLAEPASPPRVGAPPAVEPVVVEPAVVEPPVVEATVVEPAASSSGGETLAHDASVDLPTAPEAPPAPSTSTAANAPDIGSLESPTVATKQPGPHDSLSGATGVGPGEAAVPIVSLLEASAHDDAVFDDEPVCVVLDFRGEASPGSADDASSEATNAEAPAIAPPVSEAIPPSPPRALPLSLASFEAFVDEYWSANSGEAVIAPWRQPGFGERSLFAFESELASRPLPFHRLWLLSAGVHPHPALPGPSEVEALAACWVSGSLPPADAARTASLREGYGKAEIGPSARWRVAVLLEALSTTSEPPLDAALLEEVVHQLELGDHGFEVALLELFSLRARVSNHVLWLRPLLGPSDGKPVAELEQGLAQHRRTLFEFYRSVMQAGGGTIQQTHCREAWRAFVDRVHPGLTCMFPEAHGGGQRWDTTEVKTFIEQIVEIHKLVADRRGALLKDRVKMDRIAERLAGHARAVNDELIRLDEARSHAAGRVGKISVRKEVFQTLHNAATPEGQVGGLREILVRALFPPTVSEDAPQPLDISIRDIQMYPDMLDLLPAVGGTAAAPELGRVQDVVDPRAAAALLLGSPERQVASSLPELLRSSGRAHLLGKVVALCPESERQRIHAEHDALLEKARRLVAELGALRLRLADAASAVANVLLEVHRSALDCIERKPTRAMLLLAWLEALVRFARSQLDVAVEHIRNAAVQRGQTMLAQVAPKLETQRYAEALTLLQGSGLHAARHVRHTMSRHDAGVSFRSPLQRLSQEDVSSRVTRWLAKWSDLNQERAQRSEFARLVLDDIYPREPDPAAISVRCEVARRRIDERQLNPSFVPQLQRFAQITFPRVIVRPEDPSFPVRAAEAAGQHQNDLVIVVAPRITAARRESVLHELRRRNATAAVVDDLDLCRILNPGGVRPDALLALLEVALEQQRWTTLSPFGVVEGQHVQLEMYVGRRDEARALAHTSRYSRLFSGRKLGKSALLRYVEQRYDGGPLPSGKRLRVLYVSAVGIDTDVALVDQIVASLANRCGRDGSHGPIADEEPAARLERVLRTHIDNQPDESLLIVLDEADAFVEAELERYQLNPQERCLSWIMSRRIENARDQQGLPRVRFVFTGYRVTNTRDGVWFNWGDVLQLVPLPVDEAAELIAAPLGRLGIDGVEQAPIIAHRCGYQPAVLLRFGERLLVRLEQAHHAVTREHTPVRVTADDVAATFEEDAVQDEIRRVTSNNFRDNDIGAVLFGALLGLFLGMGPAAVLEGAEDRLVEKIRALDGGDFAWLVRDGDNLHEQIRMKLRDLVARQLLDEQRLPGDRTGYSLRFPHHLTVLSPLAREERLRDAIRRVKAGADAVARQRRRGLLSRDTLDSLRGVLSTKPDPSMPIVPVVGHLWSLDAIEQLSLLHRGLFDPLGLDRAKVQPATSVGAERVRGQAYHGVSAGAVDALLEGWPTSHPVPLLVGGIDILRLAVTSSRSLGEPRRLLEAIGLGRLSRGHLSWWFERARGFGFSQQDAIERILERTSGIPLLVGQLDRFFTRHDPHGGGLEVTAELLSQALSELASGIPTTAGQLSVGADDVRLSRREVELLCMLAFAAKTSGPRATSSEDISEELWPMYASELPEGSPLASAQPLRAEALTDDLIALEVLQLSGLLPVRPDVKPGLVLESLAPLSPDDALISLARTLL